MIRPTDYLFVISGAFVSLSYAYELDRPIIRVYLLSSLLLLFFPLSLLLFGSGSLFFTLLCWFSSCVVSWFVVSSTVIIFLVWRGSMSPYGLEVLRSILI